MGTWAARSTHAPPRLVRAGEKAWLWDCWGRGLALLRLVCAEANKRTRERAVGERACVRRSAFLASESLRHLHRSGPSPPCVTWCHASASIGRPTERTGSMGRTVDSPTVSSSTTAINARHRGGMVAAWRAAVEAPLAIGRGPSRLSRQPSTQLRPLRPPNGLIAPRAAAVVCPAVVGAFVVGTRAPCCVALHTSAPWLPAALARYRHAKVRYTGSHRSTCCRPIRWRAAVIVLTTPIAIARITDIKGAQGLLRCRAR